MKIRKTLTIIISFVMLLSNGFYFDVMAEEVELLEENTTVLETIPSEEDTLKPETTPPVEDTSNLETTLPEEGNSKPETSPPEEDTSQPETSPPEEDTSKPETSPPEEDTSKPEITPPEENTSQPEIVSLRQDIVNPEIPTFSVEMVEGGEAPGLYGTLSFIPSDAAEIRVLYSIDGIMYRTVEYLSDEGIYDETTGTIFETRVRTWDLMGLDNLDGEQPKLTQICILPDDNPLKAYTAEKINTFYIKLCITDKNKNKYDVEPIKVSHNKSWDIPEEAPDFSAEVILTNQGYLLEGTFKDFLPDTKSITPLYSLDGIEYTPFLDNNGNLLGDWNLENLGDDREDYERDLQTQICSRQIYEPVKSYIDKKLDSFYVKLQIETESGKIYHSAASVIKRESTIPVPEDSKVLVWYPVSMQGKEGRSPYFKRYGKYQVTVWEGITEQELRKLLPDTLPLEVQIHASHGQMVDQVIVERPVEWNFSGFNLDGNEDEVVIIRNAATVSPIPAGEILSMSSGNYILEKSPEFDTAYCSEEVRLFLNIIPKGTAPEIVLSDIRYGPGGEENTAPLSLALPLKPSGATSIKAYSYVEGDEDWVEIGELIERRKVDYNQAHALYGYVNVLNYNQAPFSDYLQEKINRFLIGVTITGGVYDGKTVMVAWPDEYNLPARIPELNGSGGNENNAGSGGGDTDGSRPSLPDTDKPPNTILPPDTDDSPDTDNPPDSGNPPSVQPPNDDNDESEEPDNTKPPEEIQPPTGGGGRGGSNRNDLTLSVTIALERLPIWINEVRDRFTLDPPVTANRFVVPDVVGEAVGVIAPHAEQKPIVGMPNKTDKTGLEAIATTPNEAEEPTKYAASASDNKLIETPASTINEKPLDKLASANDEKQLDKPVFAQSNLTEPQAENLAPQEEEKDIIQPQQLEKIEKSNAKKVATGNISKTTTTILLFSGISLALLYAVGNALPTSCIGRMLEAIKKLSKH